MPMISRGCPVSHLSPWRPARLPSFSCLSSFSHALWPDEVAEGSSQRSRTGGADRGKQLLRTGGGDGDRPLRGGVGRGAGNCCGGAGGSPGDALRMRLLQPHPALVSRTFPDKGVKAKAWGNLSPLLRATNKPPGPFLRKKGLRRKAKFPLVIQMVPKGGLDRLSLGHPGQRTWRRGFMPYRKQGGSSPAMGNRMRAWLVGDGSFPLFRPSLRHGDKLCSR